MDPHIRESLLSLEERSDIIDATYVLICYSIHINIHLLMLMVLPVIWITAMIRELKYIVPLSTLANVSIFTAFGLILYRACHITDSIYDRRWIGDWDQLPLCFGVVIYSLEGIGLVLPLQQNMKQKERFLGPCGVLNLSLSFVTLLIATFGFLGYFKYGDNVKESLTLNLEAGNSLLTQVVICSLVLGILCTYALQFFIPVILIVPDCQEWFGKHFSAKSHTLEYILRSVLVLCTFLTAELIPHLDLFVSLVGAVGGTFLALIFTPLADIANRKNRKDGFMKWRLIFAAISLAVGFFGFFVGTIMSLKEIIVAIKRDFNLA